MTVRQRNWRVVIVGGVLIAAAIGFFYYMLGISPSSNDPAALMTIVGQVSGAVIGLSVVMIIFGLIGRKA